MNYFFKIMALLVCLGCLMVQRSIRANNSSASAIALDHNQKLVVAGVADNGTNNVFALARLNLDGSPDVTFNPSGVGTGVSSQVVTDINGTDASIIAMVIDANNKIVVAGTALIPSTVFGATFQKFIIARYNNDGTLDATFNPNGNLSGSPGFVIVSIGSFNDIPTALVIDSVGRIVVVGTTNNGTATDMAIVRLTPTGALDLTFTSIVQTPPDFGSNNTATITPGLFTIQPGIQVLTINANDVATCVTIGNLDSIFVAGYTTVTQDNFLIPTAQQVVIALAKILDNGFLDTTFFNPMSTPVSPLPGVILQSVNGVQEQINAIGIDVNKSLVLGGFTDSNGIDIFLLVRYTQDGELFETIQTNILASDSVIQALTFDANNKIVVSGAFENGTASFNFTQTANLAFVTARYNLDGSLDPTFNPLGTAGSIVAQPGVVITNAIPDTTNITTFNNLDNQSLGVVTDASNNVYVTGYSNEGTQTDFTTISYIPTGGLNTAFNAEALQAGPPGFALNVFFGVLQPGNGIPITLGGDISALKAMDLQQIRSNEPSSIEPIIVAHGPLITNNKQPTLNGTASPNAIVSILVNDIPIASAVADNKGNWSVTFSDELADGTYSVTAVSEDPITTITQTSQPVSLTIDTQVPTQPTIESPHEGQTIRSSTFVIRGKTKPESQVTIFMENREIGHAIAQASGTWEFETEPVLDGPQAIHAIARDKAGNISASSAIVNIRVDTGKPRAPRILTPKHGETVRKSPVQITGEGTSNSTINIFLNDKIVGKAKINEKGSWIYVLPVKEGHYQLKATTIDGKLVSEIVPISVDLKLVTKRARQAEQKAGKGLISGKAEPGSVITLILDGSQLGKVIADQYGTWSYNPPPNHPLEKGKHLLKVSITDPSGKAVSLVDREITL